MEKVSLMAVREDSLVKVQCMPDLPSETHGTKTAPPDAATHGLVIVA